MTVHTYFLGANTPDGFFSYYTELFRDGRLRKTVIIKGGPGCGKSTLMRAVGRQSEDLGFETEQLLCSSDPDSLDGIIIPDAGLAIVDGTAPHVLEPPLCGCGAEYLDLGACYRKEPSDALKARLEKVKAQNASYYPLASACFRAVKATSDALLGMIIPEGIGAITVALSAVRQSLYGSGSILRRFYTALTPKGALGCALPCQTVWVLKDNYGAATHILSQTANRLQEAGYDLILGFDPLAPQSITQLVIPELSTGYTVSNSLFPYSHPAVGTYDIDILCTQHFSAADAKHAAELLIMKTKAADQGLRFLAEAKQYHDTLETLYRDYVDFSFVEEKTAQMNQLLTRMLPA